MNQSIHTQLFAMAQTRQNTTDPSHDFSHIRRVLGVATKIAESVNADMDVVVAAALFHDIVTYQKNDPRNANAAEESAVAAGEVLAGITEYPQTKIPAVQACIRECSFSKGTPATSLESEVLQDSDRLEATGAISVMRTCASSGQMNRQFYDLADPFREHTEPVKFASTLDLFYLRLLIVEKTMHTELGKTIARHRTAFLEQFLVQLKQELIEAGEYQLKITN